MGEFQRRAGGVEAFRAWSLGFTLGLYRPKYEHHITECSGTLPDWATVVNSPRIAPVTCFWVGSPQYSRKAGQGDKLIADAAESYSNVRVSSGVQVGAPSSYVSPILLKPMTTVFAET